MGILLSILLVLAILLSILLSWFRNSKREENQIEEWELQRRPPENRPKRKAKGKKFKAPKHRKQEPPVLPLPPVPSTPLNEYFSSDLSREEISSVLDECGKDSDEAFKRLNARLDSQDQFLEAKPKRGRRNRSEAQGSNASSINTDEVTIDGGSNVEPAPAQESLNVDAENTREDPLVAPSVTSQQLEAQGSNASSSNTDEVTIDAGSNVEPAPAQESVDVDAENTRENPLVAPSVTSSPSLSNAMIAMNEQPSYNRKIAEAGSLISPSPALSHQIWPTTIGAFQPLGSKNFAEVVRLGESQATVSHMVGETSPTSPLSEVFRESQEVQVSERSVTSENSSSNIAQSNGSFTREGDTCKVEGASQSNDGSVEEMASHNLPVEENERREVGSGSLNNDIPATALSLDQLTLGQEDKEVSSLSDDTSTTVLPERVQAQDDDFSHLSSCTINFGLNTTIQSNENDPVKYNLNDSSANLNGSSSNISTLAPAPATEILTFREYHPIYWGQALVEPNRSSSLTGHNAALSSLQPSYLGDPHFPNTSSFNLRHYGNISAPTNSPRSMLENFSSVSNRYGTGYYGAQRTQANHLAMPQQAIIAPLYPSGSRTLSAIPSYTHHSGLARGQSLTTQGSRFYNLNQQRVPDIQRQNQLQLGIPGDRYKNVQSDLSGSRYQNVQGQRPLVSRSNHFPQASSTALLPTNPGNFPPSSSNQSLQGHRQGRAGRFCRDAARAAIIAPLRNSPGQIQRPSQSDAAFRPRDAGSSTALDSEYQLFQRLSQPLLSGSISPSTSLFSSIPDDLPPGSSYQNVQGQGEQLSDGDDPFPPLQSMLPPDLLESSSDRTQGSSEDQEQP